MLAGLGALLPPLHTPPPHPHIQTHPWLQVAELCEAASAEVPAGQGVRIANYLCNGNYAVSGGVAGCEAVERLAKSFKARMTVRLAVAGAFHTDFMAPAREQLQAALASTNIKVGGGGGWGAGAGRSTWRQAGVRAWALACTAPRAGSLPCLPHTCARPASPAPHPSTTVQEPRLPVISNVDAAPHSDPDTIKKILAQQLTGPVQFEGSVKTLLERGLERSYEIGPNKVIAGIMKRIDKVRLAEGLAEGLGLGAQCRGA